ncbi:MAG: HAD-IIIC family phosphatase [Gemmatimonadaceae bacterium]
MSEQKQPGASVVRCLLISDFTIDLLGDCLRRSDGPPTIKPEVLPFGQVTQSLIQLGAAPRKATDCVVVWTRPESIHLFRRALDFEQSSAEEIISEVDAFVELIAGAAANLGAVFVPSWTMPNYRRGLGPVSLRSENGSALALMRMNLRLAERIRVIPNAFMLDAARWVAAVGRRAANPKLWYMGKVAFGLEVFEEAAADIRAALRALSGSTAKAVVVDLDDVLWGGVVGETGWQDLRLGGHDTEGEAFVEFQRELKALSRAGVILGIVSKNDESTAFEAIEQHPEMVLRRRDFAGWRINWRDKAANLADLAAELNIGLDAVVFIDDNPAERSRVREALPEVVVPDWPADHLLYTRALLELRSFDRTSVTTEDAARNRMYTVDRDRREARASFSSLGDWLSSLDMTVIVEPVSESNLPRVAQLLNKTNQMNLVTRRMGETELLAWSREPTRRALAFTVRDRFGDYGLTGIASIEVREDAAEITDYLLSCRVMGRGVEETMLHTIISEAQRLGAVTVRAQYIPTARNRPCLEFFETRSSMKHTTNSHLFEWGRESYPLPGHVRLTIDRLGETEPSTMANVAEMRR